jgi:hypothetical protein
VHLDFATSELSCIFTFELYNFIIFLTLGLHSFYM